MSKNNPMKVGSKPQRARNSYLREDRQRKRAEAAVRQDIYNKLSIEEKLAKLDAGNAYSGFRPFTAAKQRIVLSGQFNAGKAAERAAERAAPEPVEKPAFKKGAKAERQRRHDKKAAKSA